MSEIPTNSHLSESMPPQAEDRLVPGLDRDRMNELIRASSQTGVYFGRGLELTDYDRIQFSLIADAVDGVLEPEYNDPAWQSFQSLVDEGATKGVLTIGNKRIVSFVDISVSLTIH
jgi:hypothetical protein